MRFVYCLGMAVSVLAAPARPATLFAGEDFDGTTPTWTNDIASKTFVDTVEPLYRLAIQPADTGLGSGNILYSSRTDAHPTFGTAPISLNFDAVDLTGHTGVFFSFDYALTGFDSGESIDYVLSLAGATDAIGSLTGSDAGSALVSVPDTATSASLTVTVDQDGIDVFRLDNFALTGDAIAVVPEPGIVTLAGAGLLALWWRWRGGARVAD